MAAVQDARAPGDRTAAATAAEAILVSHQLPIWATRLSAEGSRCGMTRASASAR